MRRGASGKRLAISQKYNVVNSYTLRWDPKLDGFQEPDENSLYVVVLGFLNLLIHNSAEGKIGGIRLIYSNLLVVEVSKWNQT